MTNGEELLDKETDADSKIMENDDDDALNAAYDRVSGSGEMPSLEDFLEDGDDGLREDDLSFGDGIGDEYGDPKISGQALPEDEEQASDCGGADDGDGYDSISPMSILNGTFFKTKGFIRNIPFVLVLGVIGMIYIANRNFTEYQIGRCIRLKKEVRNLRAESITIAGQLMDISRETEVARRVEDRRIGIHEQHTPPLYFVIDKYVAPDSLLKGDEAPKRHYVNDFNDFEDDFKEMN